MSSDEDQYHHGNLREALVDEVKAIVREEGLNAVSMRSLSDRLEVSRSAAYRHFEGKSEILAEVAGEGFTSLKEELAGVRTNTTDYPDIGGRFRAMGRTYVQFAVEHPAYYRLMFQWDWSDDEHGDLASAGQSTFEELVSGIETGQDDGVFRDGETEEMAFSAWALVHGISLLAIEGHADRLVEDVSKLNSVLGWIGRGLLSD